MIYNGQLDVIIAFPQTENFLNALDWTGKYVYAMTPRTIWKVQGEVAGYVRTHHMFTRILNFLLVIVFSKRKKNCILNEK